ncbi:MAG: glycerate kinase [Burkholderiaceae bacterium]|nr:glycerate kinase [Burkholderiaceae bacterium]
MPFPNILIPLACLALLVAGWQMGGWLGVAAAAGALVMWLLLHYTRLLTILKRAAERPIGFVPSAVMLNARLKPGVTLMHVVAMTRSLGALQSPKNEQPELFRWSDEGGSHVTCEFLQGKLVRWVLERPVGDGQPAEAGGAAPPAP